MKEVLAHLRRRAMLSGGVVYVPPRDRTSAGEGPAPRQPAAEREIIVKTSPAGPPAVEAATSPRDLKEGVSRDTRPPAQEGLFEGGGGAEGALDVGFDELERMVAGCTRCGLHETRTNTVFGDGDGSSGLVFIGEAPGRDEDLQGVPFVGRAGKLLDRMIAAIGFSREEVYIANILKCRPPNNRDPKEDEVSSCEKYLARQIELLEPRIICALGRVAGQNLLGTKAPLRALREGIHNYNGIRVIVTYHPAALLRNPNWKKGAWEDLQLLKRLHGEMGG
jgi:DNA polymerase